MDETKLQESGAFAVKHIGAILEIARVMYGSQMTFKTIVYRRQAFGLHGPIWSAALLQLYEGGFILRCVAEVQGKGSMDEMHTLAYEELLKEVEMDFARYVATKELHERVPFMEAKEASVTE